MVVLAQCVYGDRYSFGSIYAIPYKLFVASGEDNSVALRAAVALHYDDPTALVYAAGTELWTFASEATGVPPNPPAHLALTPKTGGTLLPSTFSSMDTNGLPKPWPYLAAIQRRCLSHLARELPLMRPFGDSLLDPETGRLVHLTPGISGHGHVYLRINQEITQLRTVVSSNAKLIWLLPIAKPARLVDTFAPPSSHLARSFYSVVQGLYPISTPFSVLEESLWVHVAVSGKDFLWPAVFTVAIPVKDSKALASMSNNDPYVNLMKHMKTVHSSLSRISSDTVAGHDSTPGDYHDISRASKRQRPGHTRLFTPASMLPPPPPTPSLATTTLVNNPAAVAALTATSPSSLSPNAVSSLYPTPTGANTERREFWITPESTNGHNWTVDEDEEEVTIADFNYFDMPLQSRENSEVTNVVTEQVGDPETDNHISAESNSTETTRNSQEKSELPQDRVSSGSSLPRFTSSFTSLTFPNNISSADAKYSAGGRYFTPLLSESHNGTETSPTRIEDNDGLSQEDCDSDQDSDVNEGDDECFDVAPSLACVDDIFGASSLGNEEQARASLEAWEQTLLSTSVLSVGDNISTDNLQLMMAQIVWDDGMLRQLSTSPLPVGDIELVDESIIRHLRQIQPEMSRYDLSELCKPPSGTLVSSPTQSTSLMPPLAECPLILPPSAQRQTPSNSANVDSPGMQEDPVFTLLSPPLYSVTRMDQPHKARASILRFWKTLGLQPNPPTRDITVIHMTMVSARLLPCTKYFLDYLKLTYESCNLGKLNLPTMGNIIHGILNISADLEYTSPDTISDLYETLCSMLKRQLANSPENNNPVILFMAYPPAMRTSLMPLARGFQALRTTFPNMRWLLASSETLVSPTGSDVLPSQYKMMRLAVLIYDRWVSRTYHSHTSLVSEAEPAFSLARLAPHSINIKYSPQVPTQIMDEDPIMHVSYAVSHDGRWVAVSWSDQWAALTKIEVLRLVGSSKTRLSSPVLTPISEDSKSHPPDLLSHTLDTFMEIWRRTFSHCSGCRNQQRYTKWRIAIVKCGSMSISEMNSWLHIVEAAQPQKSRLAQVYLLSLPQPRPLYVRDNNTLFISFNEAERTVSSSIPSISSSQLLDSSPAAPLSGEAGPAKRNDNVIVSIMDETHGIVFENRLYELGFTACASVTGVLVKPLIPVNSRGHQQLEIYLVHCSSGKPKHIMKQILGQYRRLSSLAEYTGVSAETTILPWHVAATNKMVTALAAL